MKKKTMIILIAALVLLVILCLSLCTRKDNNSPGQGINQGNTEQEKEDAFDNTEDEQSQQTVIEDEVTLDYAGAIEDDTDVDVDSNEDAEDNAEIPKVEEPNRDDSSVENDSEEESTESKNPYDKDGDGFVDGWY